MNSRDLSSPQFRLLNEFQRDFPLIPAPFDAIGRRIGLETEDVLAMLRHLQASGSLSRIGAVFAPRRVGASTLAAARVDPARLEEAAGTVSGRREVNHNYEREHDWNLWFVVTAPDAAHRDRVLREIEQDIASPVISLPLREEFHIDLGFDLASHGRHLSTATNGEGPCALPALEQSLMAAIENGLPLVPRPFEAIGAAIGLSEAFVLETLQRWQLEGLVKRFGIVVRHRELGYVANAMCVWDIPDDRIQAAGRALAQAVGVNLCYRRERALPDWPYNLYCMIHGKTREDTLAQRDAAARSLGLDAWPHTVLFSLRGFKQCGARYTAESAA